MLITALLFLPLTLGCGERGSKAASSSRTDADGDGYFAELDDCDDDDGDVHPGVKDFCDGIDNDCDGLDGASEDQYNWYPDADEDGYGDLYAAATLGCQAPDTTTSWVPDDNLDCDDSNNEVRPDGTELCNGLDDDCDGATDEDVTAENGAVEVWPDLDGDGQGDMTAEPVLLCAETPDYATNSDDCDDEEEAIYVGATELCNDLDDDCDGGTDDDDPDVPKDAELWCVDNDKDGFSPTGDVGYLACEPEEVGDILCATDSADRDWDDDDSSVYPGAPEYCDAIDKDNDQDGTADEEPSVNPTTWYRDADDDDHGSQAPEDAQVACNQPSGYVENSDDCDDDAPSVFIGHAELCGDALDNDCDSSTDQDAGCTDYNVNSATEWFAGDVNLDGREDVILYLCTSDHLPEPATCTGADPGTTTTDCWVVAYAKSTGDGFHNYNIWSVDAGKGADQRWVVDVNSDGAVDLVWVEDTNSDTKNEWRVALADPTRQVFTTESSLWMPEESVTSSSSTEHRLMGDVNGDGFADIVYIDGETASFSLGTGTSFGGFGAGTRWDSEPTLSYGEPDKFVLGDVNGDGRDDLVVFFIDNFDPFVMKNNADYGEDGLADVDGAWLVLLSNGATFNAPVWWLGVNDDCQDDVEPEDTEDTASHRDGCGNWADDVFVANYTNGGATKTADAIGFFEDVGYRSGEADGAFFAGRSNGGSFDDGFETNPLTGTRAFFASCAVRSTFVGEGSFSYVDREPRAILFADVNGDGLEDALAFQVNTWAVALSDSSTNKLQSTAYWTP